MCGMSREEHDSRYFFLTRLSIVGMHCSDISLAFEPTKDTEM